MSEFIILKFQRLALVLDLAFSVQGTEERSSVGNAPQHGLYSFLKLVDKGYPSICLSILHIRVAGLLWQRKTFWDRLCRAKG